ncbi:MAG: glycoside hydrolase family 11 protein [Polyangiaceae bacterium]
MPSGGNRTCLSSSSQYAQGTADGLTWTEWTNGSGGCITTFSNADAYSGSWSDGGDYLARLGLNFSGNQSYTYYGTITAQFAESRTGSAGGYSSIGIYGWMWNPCVEYYIVEDSFNGLSTSNVTTTIDGGTYYLSTNMTSGSGGNSCEPGHTGGWTQMWSYRQTARQCGTITITDHFNAWKNQGWSLGDLSSAQVNVEVGGGTGSIDFTLANVTTTSN